jgi:hypothetical protein
MTPALADEVLRKDRKQKAIASELPAPRLADDMMTPFSINHY